MHPEDDGPVDPDNMPARSRLFLVVPKAADAAAIEVSTYASWVKSTASFTSLIPALLRVIYPLSFYQRHAG
jgi:hypothetical protein